MWLIAAWWLAGCGPSRPAAVPTASAGPSVALSVDVPFAELEVPADSRDGRAPPDTIPIAGPWVLVSGTDNVRKYRADLPVRPRALFFMHPPAGMVLHDAKGALVPPGASRGRSWAFDATSLTISLPIDEEPPAANTWTVAYPFATGREVALNHAFSKVTDPAAFVRTTVQVGPETMAGLLIPAPGHAAFDVTVPPAGELWLRPGLVPPETLDDAPSDGVTLRIEVDSGGRTEVVWTEVVAPGDPFADVHVDLSKFAGQQVRIRFVSEPGATARFDYAFFGDPVLASRKSDPKRVVLVFVDTLRRDHLGVYGDTRDVSVPLDEWAKGAVVFDDARSTAPWTLPSSRAIFTGREPEFWGSADTIEGDLRKQGFATAMFAANIYLSSNFDMQRDWGLHRVERAVPATEEVDRALAWLGDHDGRDALLCVHFMDAHLPYEEPAAYRYRYTRPDAMGARLLPDGFERGALGALKNPGPAVQGYVKDRYDQNVAYIHDEVGRLLRNLGPDDVVVYFADHGEEFWDHGGFEHGHTLFDELLRVPLIVKAPGIAAGRVPAPVSLMDITPTVLDLLGQSTKGLDGRSLVPAMRGDAAALASLDASDLGFGRPLYGSERWGVLHDGKKYDTTEGREHLFDVNADAPEKSDLLLGLKDEDGVPWRTLLEGALGRPVRLGFRIWPTRASMNPADDLVVRVQVPGGVADAWVGDDPTDGSAATVKIDGDVVEARWLAGFRGSREVFFVPTAPVAEVTHTLVMSTFDANGKPVNGQVPPERTAVPSALRAPLMRGPVPGGRMVALGHAITVAPAQGGHGTVASDAEVRGALESLGYVFDEKPPEKPQEPPKP